MEKWPRGTGLGFDNIDAGFRALSGLCRSRMKEPMNRRREMLFLLLRTGVVLGLMLATVNWARHVGWGSLAFTLAPILVAGLVLGAFAALREGVRWPARFWGYSAISGGLGIVLPNWLVFVTISQDGVITAAVFYLLSPLFTQLLTWLLGFDRLAPVRVVGLLLGMVGATILVLAPTALMGKEATVPLVGLFIPLSLAVGNIYRKQYMPVERSALSLAAGMLLGSGLLFIPLYLTALLLGWPGTQNGGLTPLAVQSLIMGLGFISYFQFLRRVDPVYFSQLGYLVTLTGGLAGVIFFGETLGWHHAVSLVLVTAGVWLVTRQDRRPGSGTVGASS